MTKKIDIQIVSDPVCPWCYIGLSRLNKAIAKMGNTFAFNKTFVAYQLHPWMPNEGMPQKQLLEMKYGVAATKEMSENLSYAAGLEGVTINYGKIQKVPNTFNAHLLIKEAQKINKAEAFYLHLFKAFFEDGEDIGEKEVLQSLIQEMNLEISLEKLFSNETKKEELRAEENNFRNKGIAAVPTYIINNQKLIEGAQNSAYFQEVFLSL